MEDYKFKIGEFVTFSECSEEFQSENFIQINHRRIKTVSLEIDDEPSDIHIKQYSEEGTAWYLENSLELRKENVQI